jgi:hypothetical protein
MARPPSVPGRARTIWQCSGMARRVEPQRSNRAESICTSNCWRASEVSQGEVVLARYRPRVDAGLE